MGVTACLSMFASAHKNSEVLNVSMVSHCLHHICSDYGCLPGYDIALLLNFTVNGVLPGDSVTIIRHKYKYHTIRYYAQQNTTYNATQTIKDTLHTMNTMLWDAAVESSAYYKNIC
jgi:hypothetical protein